jgi:hypothetical protein
MGKTIEQRVAAGAALLDRVVPGWASRVNVETLAMWDPSRCIIGQVVANGDAYNSGAYSDFVESHILGHFFTYELGFDADQPPLSDRYSAYMIECNQLHTAWVGEIGKRK